MQRNRPNKGGGRTRVKTLLRFAARLTATVARWVAHIAVRHPAHAAWCVAGLVLWLVVTHPPPEVGSIPRSPEDHSRWVQINAEMAVQDCLSVIGHGVTVDAVMVEVQKDWIGATYSGYTNTIAFNWKSNLDETGYLAVAGHECVHAIFDQAGLVPRHSIHREYYSLIEETAAQVLGARIAGQVWSRRGNDGDAWARQLIRWHRDACDPTVEWSMPRTIAANHGPGKHNPIDYRHKSSLIIHFSAPELVDKIDRVSQNSPGPWEAAHTIFREFMNPIRAPEESDTAFNEW